MFVPLAEYAAIRSNKADTLGRKAGSGALTVAQKNVRDWVDSAELHPVKRRKAKKRISVVSLFSGCGGMDLGFLGGFNFLGKHYCKTDFNIIWANEINPIACETYRKNIGKHIIAGDINNELQNIPKHADVIIGGFPCQDISINGKMLGIKGKQSSLYTAMVEATKKLQPQVFVAENVGGLLLKRNAASLNKILADFSSLGYELQYQAYRAEDYGVPQTRERVFIVGTRKDGPKFTPPKPTISKPITAAQAIGDLESIPSNKEFSHIWSLAKVSGEQGNRRLVADRPGYTIRAECHGNIQFHYSLPRRISMREAARIQSFPDTFKFCGKLRETERQIGNAVPPVLAWHIAKAIEPLIERE